MNNMDWIAKMKTAMELIHSACKENTDWAKCEECPFETYCNIIYCQLQVAPDQPKWVRMGGEDIR